MCFLAARGEKLKSLSLIASTSLLISGVVLVVAAGSYYLAAKLARLHTTVKIQTLEQLLKRQSEDGERLTHDLNARRSEIADVTTKLQAEIERRSIAEERAGRVSELDRKICDFESKAATTSTLVTSLTAEKAQLETRLWAAEQAAPSADAIKSQMTAQFQSLASQILTENSKLFSEQNQSSLRGLLDPLREGIREFQRKVEETHSTDIRERTSLKAELARIEQLNRQMSDDAVNLTNALKGNIKSQGTWGEFVLERVLESSGLREGHEFARQPSVDGENGDRQQPDIVIQLPSDRCVIVDSKVSLTAYEQYARADSDAARTVALKAHVQSVRAHIKRLGEKSYQKLYAHKSLDFVLMFIPIESAALLAVENDREMQQEAWRHNIVLATPTNLVATLRIIANLWLREQQSQYARVIAQHCASLYDKFVGFVEDLEDVGTKLGTTQRSYDAAMNKLHAGRGNLIRQVDRIRNLGIRPSKRLPERILDRATADDTAEDESGRVGEDILGALVGPEQPSQSCSINEDNVRTAESDLKNTRQRCAPLSATPPLGPCAPGSACRNRKQQVLKR